MSANNALATTPKSARIPRSRFWFTSVYFKTLRDLRVGILGWGIGFGVVVVSTIAAYEAAVSSPAAQAALIATAKAWNWYWEAVGMDTAGGYAMWKLGVILTFPAIWGLLAGSRILRGEEERGSLDMLLSLPRSRGRAAVEKVAALGTALLLMGLLIGVLTAWGGARANAGFSFGDALLFGLNISLISAVFAALALFISQFTHERSTAAGLTGALFGFAILLNSLAHIAPDIDGLAHLSPVYLFALSKPLVPGRGVDAVAMLALAGTSLVFAALAVLLFLRRDVGATIGLPQFASAASSVSTAHARELPSGDLALRSVYARSLRTLAGPTLWWGLAIAFFGAVFTLMARQTEQGIAGAFKGTPYEQIINTLTGGGEIGSGVWFLSLIFAELPLVFTIYALIQASNWAEDEENGRFELLLANPQARWRVLLARYAAFVTSLLVIAAALLLAVVLAGIQQNLPLDGGKAVAAVAGMLPIALVVASVGYLLSGWLRSGAVTAILGALLALSFLVELVGAIFKWPDWVVQLSIFERYGSPFTKGLEWTNVIGLLAVAAAALAIAIWRFSQKDIAH
ncbi:MAG TPA: ABC transporter permease subunit [Ktedonobacterales bacterium]